MAHSLTITFDCADADVMTAFWGPALGYRPQPPPGDFATWPEFLEANDIPVPPDGQIGAVVDPDGVGPRLLFLRVPEGKTAKNRMHLDIHVSSVESDPVERRALIDAKVAELVALGATAGAQFDTHEGVWTVMADPEGNEFCVV